MVAAKDVNRQKKVSDDAAEGAPFVMKMRFS